MPGPHITVTHAGDGIWVVADADGRAVAHCETLEDARRIAFLAAAHGETSELLVCDIHDHVVDHEAMGHGVIAPHPAHR